MVKIDALLTKSLTFLDLSLTFHPPPAPESLEIYTHALKYLQLIFFLIHSFSGYCVSSLLHLHRSIPGDQAANDPVGVGDSRLHDVGELHHDPEPAVLSLGGLLDHEHRVRCPGLHDLVGREPGRGGAHQLDHVHRLQVTNNFDFAKYFCSIISYQRGLFRPHLLPLHVRGGEVPRSEDRCQFVCPWSAHHPGRYEHSSWSYRLGIRSQLPLYHIFQDDFSRDFTRSTSWSYSSSGLTVTVWSWILRETRLKTLHHLDSIHHGVSSLHQTAFLLHCQPRVRNSRRIQKNGSSSISRRHSNPTKQQTSLPAWDRETNICPGDQNQV